MNPNAPHIRRAIKKGGRNELPSKQARMITTLLSGLAFSAIIITAVFWIATAICEVAR